MARTVQVVTVVAAVVPAFELPVHAYLDPGSGSMLLQVLLGGFAAVGVAIRLYWQRGTARFRRKKVEHGRRRESAPQNATE